MTSDGACGEKERQSENCRDRVLDKRHSDQALLFLLVSLEHLSSRVHLLQHVQSDVLRRLIRFDTREPAHCAVANILEILGTHFRFSAIQIPSSANLISKMPNVVHSHT